MRLTLPDWRFSRGVNQAAGSLFFSLAQVVVPCRLSLFIELTQEADPDGATAEIQLFYWSIHGWQPLSVVSDDTGATPFRHYGA
jgi:hypothetical protein